MQSSASLMKCRTLCATTFQDIHGPTTANFKQERPGTVSEPAMEGERESETRPEL